MPESNDVKLLHDLATDLLKSGDLATATQKLASAITDDFALAVTISADYLSRVVVTQNQKETFKMTRQKFNSQDKAAMAKLDEDFVIDDSGEVITEAALRLAVNRARRGRELAKERLMEWLAAGDLPWSCMQWDGLDAESHTETEAEAESEIFSEAYMAILRLLNTLPKYEREELLHQVQCSLADVNRMYGQVVFGDEDDLAGCAAAIHAAGLEAEIEYVSDEDDLPDGFTPTTTVAATGVSKLRQDEFARWLHALVEPFGGIVMEAGYAGPAPDHTKPRPTDH